jgi:hypothetical protein
MKWTTALGVLLTIAADDCHASNQYFMPGDAFFHSALTSKLLDEIDHSEHPVFTYNRPDFLPRMMCGNVGFYKLQYNNMPASMKKNLRQVYDEIREFTPKRIEITKKSTTRVTDDGDFEILTGGELQTELNGPTMLFYNHSFDMLRFRLALKYNERWADDFAEFGPARNHARLESFVPIPEAIAEDWRDGNFVAPLKANLPPILPKKNNSTPIEVGSDVVAVITSKADFEFLYHGSELAWGELSVYLVTADGITQLDTSKGHWHPSRVEKFGEQDEDAPSEPREAR